MHQAQILNSTDAEIPHLLVAEYDKHAEYDETRHQTRYSFDDKHKHGKSSIHRHVHSEESVDTEFSFRVIQS